MSTRPFVGPVKGPIAGTIVVRNIGQDAGAQLLHREATESRKQATDEDAEPDLNLVEPGAVSGSIHEANAMSGVGEKGCTGAHAGERATFAFDTQLLLDITLRSDQAHQCFRLMGVELISNKDPGGVRIGLEGLGDVSGKVGFGARGSNAGSDDLSSGYVQVGNETLCPVSEVFKFLSLDVTRLHGQRRVETFEGLDAGHLIGTGHIRARSGERRSGLIHLTDRTNLFGQFDGVVGRAYKYRFIRKEG